MRITRENVEALLEVLERLEDNSLKDSCENWISGQDEEPKTADVREQIREAREEIEGGLDDLEGAALDLLTLLRPEALRPVKARRETR